MKFGAPQYLPWLSLAVVLAWLLWNYRVWQKQALRGWASERFLRRYRKRYPWWRQLLADVCICLAVVGMVLALARPQWGSRTSPIKRRGLDIVVALDISASMGLSDVWPSRWQRAVVELQSFAQQLTGDRIALVAFDGEAGIQSPLTDDATALKALAWHSRPGIMSPRGAGLAGALLKAQKLLLPRKGRSRARVLIVLSDGESSPARAPLRQKAAQLLKQARIGLFVVGVGLAQKPQRPAKPAGSRRRVPWTPIRSAVLRSLARAASGTYLSISEAGIGLQQIQQAIQSMARQNRQLQTSQRPVERYPWALGLTLLCLVSQRLLSR